MIPIIVATQVEDFAHIFYRDADGHITQTARVLVGPTQPSELAAIAAELSEHLAWSKIVRRSEPVEPRKPPTAESKAEMTKRQRRPHGPDRLKRSKVEIGLFDASVLRILQAHDSINIPQLTEELLVTRDKKAQSNVRSSLERLIGTGAVAKDTSVEQGEPYRYSAVSAEGHLASDSGLEPTGPGEESSPQLGG